MKQYPAKPFVKWAGGKGQLLTTLGQALPETFCDIEDAVYIEPFVGGGAMLFFMLQNFGNIKKAVISDVNINLIKAYEVIKYTPERLVGILSKIQDTYWKIPETDKRKEFYLDIRQKFNQGGLSDIDNTAYFIFLNRTCFNCLYRVNSKGQFNVPFGKYTNPTICDERTIYADSLLLQKVEVLYGDFEQTEKFAIADNTFIYCDPPYRPLTATANFSAYSVQSFSDADQIRLKKYADRLSLKHCFLMLSNADCREWNPEDNFLDELYREYHINRIQAVRCINANAAKRGKLPELLIRNYQD